MNMIKKIKNRMIYSLTEKPSCYVHVDEPKSLQDYRQLQYNNWCKAKGVFNGSYLPYKPETLLKRGWKDISVEEYKNRHPSSYQLQRKSTGQIVRYEEENETQYAHYHWENRTSLDGDLKNDAYYLDRYGKVCRKNSHKSHLAPFDKKYKKKR